MKQLSIIVPVYNVENYIHPCLLSIFSQNIAEDDFEVIIVNDGTKDNSMEVIKDIINQHTNIIIINQQNQGLSMARNNGMEIATGQYILFADSDDMIIANTLSRLMEVAIKTQADIILADYLRKTDQEIDDYIKYDCPTAPEPLIIEEKNGERMFIEDLITHQYAIWRSLLKRSFIQNNHICFIPNILYEDVPFTNECFLKADKCLRIRYPFYIYRVGHTSITSSFTKEKALSYCVSIASTWKLSSFIKGRSEELKDKFDNEIFDLYSSLICWTVHAICSKSDRIQIIDHLKQQAQDLSFGSGIKQQLMCFMYREFPHFYINMRYYYGIIWEDMISPIYRLMLRKVMK